MKLSRFQFIALFTAALLGATALFAQEKKAKKARPSPPATVTADIDGNEVKIAYSRPGAVNPKGGEVRKIWGGLVPHGQVWRTGANEATLLTTQKPLIIGGYALAAGTYSLFTLPLANGSAKLIINKRTGQWGVPYKVEEEVATNSPASTSSLGRRPPRSTPSRWRLRKPEPVPA